MSYPGKYVYLRIPIKLQLNQRHFERFLQVFSTRLTIDQTQLWKRRALHTIRRNATMVNHQDNAWSQIWASLWLMRKWKLITKLSSTWLLILAEMETQQVSKESVPSPWWLYCDWWKACCKRRWCYYLWDNFYINNPFFYLQITQWGAINFVSNRHTTLHPWRGCGLKRWVPTDRSGLIVQSYSYPNILNQSKE